jgi:acrylyl-CoA reductase (NADPH)
MVRALVVDTAGGQVVAAVANVPESALPAGNVTIDVEYSSLNYKDGLVVTGGGGLVKQYPHVPGIDCAGIVRHSEHPAWKTGDAVLLTGWRVGELHWGGYADTLRANGDWLVRRPSKLSAEHCMAIGTAGFSAMLSLMAMEDLGVSSGSGDVLVTGAAGGVGSVAVALLAERGYRVVASTGRPETREYLAGLGAAEVIDRSAFSEPAKRPLESERWAACIDSVGGNTLARVLAQTRYGGMVAAVGLAGGSKLETTVIPFLLRGVSLLGIDSVMCPIARREAAWRRLEAELPRGLLDSMIIRARLEDVPDLAPKILAGGVRGRVVVNVRS